MISNERTILIVLFQQAIDSKIDLISFIEKSIFEFSNMKESELKTSIIPFIDLITDYLKEYGENEILTIESLSKTTNIFEEINNTLLMLKADN